MSIYLFDSLCISLVLIAFTCFVFFSVISCYVSTVKILHFCHTSNAYYVTESIFYIFVTSSNAYHATVIILHQP